MLNVPLLDDDDGDESFVHILLLFGKEACARIFTTSRGLNAYRKRDYDNMLDI